ncbi:unnamed protein product [Mycena citricolor]|uniref:Carboxylesterase type B domain-containing protein n=1 Tax=Mycena citricolor TaxID=2018698 RepID=A0AAD2K443_9AGAR|nr:unnamed protein product [Mycena citricolor]
MTRTSAVISSVLLFALVARGAPTVQLGQTAVVGRSIPTFSQEFFAGIPYAEPPLGDLRFRPPVLQTSLNATTLDAAQYGPSCIQPLGGSTPGGLPTSFALSEDCLTVNILRPAGVDSTSKLPVMFWTYGGGFLSGSSVVYNGSTIVEQSVARGTPVVFVSFNYRLGPLGFPQGQEAMDQGALNLGIKDQIAALEWVQRNIGKFGGDKRKVTAFGQSAGSILTSILFLNKRVDKLARAAIFESGSQATVAIFPATRRENIWTSFVAGVPSCASLAKTHLTFSCLRNVTTQELLEGLLTSLAETNEQVPFNPVIDGPEGLIPDLPSRLLSQGKFSRIPFIAGTNLDEGTALTSQLINSTAAINASLISGRTPSVSPALLQSSIKKLLELYPDVPALGSPYGTGNNTFGLSSQYKRASAIDGDLDFHSQRRQWIEAAANAGVTTFGYLFTQPQPNGLPQLGVAHGSEVFYVFGTPADTSSASVTISRIMTDFWISFATSLTPNDGLGIPRPEWTQFTPMAKSLMQLNGANLTMIPDTFRKEQISFINSNPEIWHH